MLFKFLQKPIVVDCFTFDSFALEHAKINHARKIIPDWWKELPEEINRMSMKACKGLTGYYNNSFYLPSWVRINFKMGSNKDNSCVWESSGPVGLENHNPNQFQGFVNRDHHLFKIHTPWFMKCKENVQFLVTDPTWNRVGTRGIITLPGTMDFYNQFEVNYNFMIEYREFAREVNVMVGDPLMFFTPLSERKVVLNHHLITEQEIAKFQITRRFFLDRDLGQMPRLKIRNDYLEKNREKTKCPVGFGRE